MKKIMVMFSILAIISIAAVIKTTSDKVEAATDIKPASKFAKKIDLDKAENLMIVAHPDDETIWGGDHLLEEDYLVVCITCGTNKIRDREIREVLKISDDQLIKLGYPDNPGGVINDWSDYKEEITKDLEEIIKMHSYDKIVTHNPQGEYGHIQHIMTNQMVTAVVKNNRLTDRLYYFAKYYTKQDMDFSTAAKFPIKNYNKKVNEMIKVYESQAIICDSFEHVFSSENWQSYSDLQENAKKSVNFQTSAN